jgi:hypothetical protein
VRYYRIGKTAHSWTLEREGTNKKTGAKTWLTTHHYARLEHALACLLDLELRDALPEGADIGAQIAALGGALSVAQASVKRAAVEALSEVSP